MKRKMIFDGVNLDETIPGFRTLSVSGRQFNDVKIESLDNPGDGSTFLSSRIPERTLTVDFMLKPSNITMMDAQNVLLSHLNQDEPKRLIFTDEPDIYFNAVYSDYKVTEEHDKVRSGTIEFVCYDPFKHSTSTKTYTATSTDGTLTADVINNGNVAVPIDYKITMNSDNGYIGIVSDQGAMQFGLVEEVDGETYTQNEHLAYLTDLANAADDHGTEAGHQAARYGTAGTLTMGTAAGKSGFLTLSSVGDNTKAWNGGMKTFTLPADSEGVTGCKNFYCYFHVFLWASRWRETGHMTLSFLTADDTPICGMTWYKDTPTNNNGYYEIWTYDSNAKATEYKNQYIRVLKQFGYQCNHVKTENPWYWDWGHGAIEKTGSKLDLAYFGKYYSFNLPEIENMECAKVQFSVMAAQNRTGSLFLNACGMDVLSFSKMHVEKWKDVPNRYSSGDVMTISGDEGKMCINDMPKMGDEVTGTKYFKAEPGTNTIEIYNSTWADDVTAEITIREAWL